MILQRLGNGEAALIQDGREIIRISDLAADGPVFEAVLDGIEVLLCRDALPRLAVTYREGLFAGACGELPLDLVLVEEDPHDDPPRQVRRQRTAADPVRLQALLESLEAQPANGRTGR